MGVLMLHVLSFSSIYFNILKLLFFRDVYRLYNKKGWDFHMMDRERRTLYIIFAIVVALIAPIIVLFTPFTIGMIFYDHADKIVFLPLPSSLAVYSSAFIAVAASLVAMYFIKKKGFKIALSIFTIIAFLFLFVSGTKNYIYIDNEFIESSHWLKGKKQYAWDEIVQLDLTKKRMVESGKTILYSLSMTNIHCLF